MRTTTTTLPRRGQCNDVCIVLFIHYDFTVLIKFVVERVIGGEGGAGAGVGGAGVGEATSLTRLVSQQSISDLLMS